MSYINSIFMLHQSKSVQNNSKGKSQNNIGFESNVKFYGHVGFLLNTWNTIQYYFTTIYINIKYLISNI